MDLLDKFSEARRRDAELAVAEREAHRARLVELKAIADGALALGFTQDTPYIDGPMTCPKCSALAMPERAKAHLDWHDA